MHKWLLSLHPYSVQLKFSLIYLFIDLSDHYFHHFACFYLHMTFALKFSWTAFSWGFYNCTYFISIILRSYECSLILCPFILSLFSKASFISQEIMKHLLRFNFILPKAWLYDDIKQGVFVLILSNCELFECLRYSSWQK